MKKFISIVLAITITVSTLLCFNSLVASAATSGTCGATGSSVRWAYDASTTTLTLTGTGVTKDYGTTALNRPGWYEYRSTITKVVVGEGITKIGALNFYLFSALTSVSLPNSLEAIGGGALNYGAFRECTALTSITLPRNLTTIDDMAFRGCSALQSVVIPDSVTTLGTGTFRDCTSLTRATYGEGLTETGVETFYNTSLREVVFSSTITKISAYTFFQTKMTAIEIPEQITSIGTRAFANCTFLNEVLVNNSNTTYEGIVGEDPFNGGSATLTFYGHSASTTQAYAEEKGYGFVSIDPCEHIATHEVVTLDPTCTEKGITTQVCDECGFVVSQSELPALGHLWELTEESDEAEENGHIFNTYVCYTCGEDKTEIIHDSYVDGFYTYTNTATCTRAGIETYTCTLDGCGKVTRNISQKGNHDLADAVVNAEPTCTEKGSRTGVCTICKAEVTETLPALGHDPVPLEELDNVEDDGHTYVINECSRCEEQIIEPTHVEWMDGLYQSRVISEAHCVIDGLRRDTCDICGATRNVVLEANGQHEWYETTRTSPTCTAVGKIYYACENCDLTKSENIEALGHDYALQKSASQDPTCTAAGYNTYKCQRCSNVKKDVLNATGHTVDELNYLVLKEQTCLDEGLAASVCTVCGVEFEMTLEPYGHNFENQEVPIEDKPGHVISTPICTRCGFEDKASTVHKEWIEEYYTRTVITKGTCTVPDATRDVCSICNTSRLNTVPAPGHKYYFDHYTEDGNLVYICQTCENETSNTATNVKALFITYVNTKTSDRALGYIFDVSNDGFVNAKDFALINRVVQLTTPPPEETE